MQHHMFVPSVGTVVSELSLGAVKFNPGLPIPISPSGKLHAAQLSFDIVGQWYILRGRQIARPL
jgi:hypothetical protein